jgi:putative restriction endonuclease
LDIDTHFRISAFEYLASLTRGGPDVSLAWSDLVSFEFRGRKSPLIGLRGIWKPAALDLPISVATAPPRPGEPAPYDDEIQADDTVLYQYEGRDAGSRDSVALRNLWRENKPLIYFHGISKGVYLAAWPISVIEEIPEKNCFRLDLRPSGTPAESVAEGTSPPITKQYSFIPTRVRLHQTRFRERVMKAYQQRCSVCRLGHLRLLDAAHITPDSSESGSAETQNGLALCKIHHAAYDCNILGIDPDLIVHVRQDILAEIDGPMLRHGIQEMHGTRLSVLPRAPRDQPSKARLAERFEVFKSA